MNDSAAQNTRCMVVTDGETRAALASVRSLGARGHRVHVVAARPGSLAGCSRFAQAGHVLPDVSADPARWAKRVDALAGELGAELVVPLTEVSLGSLYTHGLDSEIRIACPDRHAYEQATDKLELMKRAAALDIAVPRGAQLGEVGALKELGRPLVVKPRHSRWLLDGAWQGADACILPGPEALGSLPRAPGVDWLVQEYIEGHGEGVFLAMREGQVLASFAHARLREKPPTGGLSVLRESLRPDPELLEKSSRLLRELGWTGVAMVEFRRTPEGRAFLMEVNPRLWGSLQLAVDAGVDFPAMLPSLHLGDPLPAANLRVGVRTRWLLGDLDHLLISLRRSEVRRATGRSVARLLWDFCRSFVDGTRLEVFRRDDWRPFVQELRARIGGWN